MMREQTNDVQSNAFEPDNQTLSDQYQKIQSEGSVLRKHYQTLFEHHHALLEGYATWQWHYSGTTGYRQSLHDYRQSLQEHRLSMQHFRQSLHAHLILMRNSRSEQNSRIPAGRLLVRKTILLGGGDEKDATLLKERLQQARVYRVFLAADSSQVLYLLHNVQIDVLVFDDGLNPLVGIELYQHLHGIRGLEALPVIIMSACFNPLLPTERADNLLIGLAKPIEVEELVRALDQLLV